MVLMMTHTPAMLCIQTQHFLQNERGLFQFPTVWVCISHIACVSYISHTSDLLFKQMLFYFMIVFIYFFLLLIHQGWGVVLINIFLQFMTLSSLMTLLTCHEVRSSTRTKNQKFKVGHNFILNKRATRGFECLCFEMIALQPQSLCVTHTYFISVLAYGESHTLHELAQFVTTAILSGTLNNWYLLSSYWKFKAII